MADSLWSSLFPCAKRRANDFFTVSLNILQNYALLVNHFSLTGRKKDLPAIK